jgi:4a-hydroxytetrahydrobiopterin dehydratase
MKPLSVSEIEQRLRSLDGWSLTPDGIRKSYRLGTFLSAMNLVNRVADLAEQASHHPDILIRYDAVTFTLTTHDSGGVTTKDFDLASRIEAIAP